MAIGRPISLTPNIASKTLSATATAGQTSFTVEGGYRINELGVYRNGVRLAQGKDFTASDGLTVTLLSGATVSDILDFVIFDSFNIADAINTVGDQTLSGELTATSGFVVGISSAGTLINDDSGPTGITTLNFIGSGNTIAYNSSTRTVDISIAGGGGGAVGTGTDKVFYENDISVAQSYTISSGKNAMSAGPITLAGSVVVTIPSGSTWTVV